jgi:hypothetical protein
MDEPRPKPHREPPEGWGQDPITTFLDGACLNSFGSFANSVEFKRAIEIDGWFRVLLDNLHRTPDWLPSLFILRSHSAFLATVRLAAAGQVPESHALQRHCLEMALYGFFISRRPDLASVWLKADESPLTRRRLKQEFKIRSIWDALEREAPELTRRAKEGYDRAIDWGGHPNQKALTASLSLRLAEGNAAFESQYLSGSPELITLALRGSWEIGVLSLNVARLIFRERFDILELSTRLRQKGCLI